MSEPKPHLTERAQAELAARREREAEALRANLRRRKEQQRAATASKDCNQNKDGAKT